MQKNKQKHTADLFNCWRINLNRNIGLTLWCWCCWWWWGGGGGRRRRL